ncbi:MAG: toll/interleukin-1 receptor domain-containing protein [Pseudomonadota bacterium]
MTAIFLSHAAEDDKVASDLEAWLHDRGFSDVFVDHGVNGIRVGDKWRKALQTAVGACRVVICIVTESWLRSKECDGEFIAARYMGKKVIPLLAVDPASGQSSHRDPNDDEGLYRDDLLQRVLREDQGCDIRTAISNDRLQMDLLPAISGQLERGLRAVGALTRVGLDPEAFEVDRENLPSPFPGLAAFDDEDHHAAIFYGRGPEIVHCIEHLRRNRAGGELAPVGIIGASGSGKSSLMRAGILPRLRREKPWICLRAFRPGATPLLNFADAIRRTYAMYDRKITTGSVRDMLLSAWQGAPRNPRGGLSDDGMKQLRAALDNVAEDLRLISGRAEATCLIALDQAEELMRAKGESSDILADYLRASRLAMDAGENGQREAEGNWRIIFTVRTDSYSALQRHPRFRGLEASGIDLRPLPVWRFDNAIDGPAARYGVNIEPGLVDRLMADEPDEDSLPLLAFTMQRLWTHCADDRVIKVDHYDDLGGISGILEDAAERALYGMSPLDEEPLPQRSPPARVLKAAKEVFVPRLIDINADGQAVRRLANVVEFEDDELRHVVEHFVRWRLLVKRGGDSLDTQAEEDEPIEVAHEALFREWPRLQEWLKPERTNLEVLQSISAAANTWKRYGKRRAYCDHRRSRLKQALQLSKAPNFKNRISRLERDYLTACRRVERFGNVPIMATSMLAVGVIASALLFGRHQIEQQNTKQRFEAVKAATAQNRADREAEEDTLMARNRAGYSRERSIASSDLLVDVIRAGEDRIMKTADELAVNALFGDALDASRAGILSAALRDAEARSARPRDQVLKLAFALWIGRNDQAEMFAEAMRKDPTVAPYAHAGLAKIQFEQVEQNGFGEDVLTTDLADLEPGKLRRAYTCDDVKASVDAVERAGLLYEATQWPGAGLNLRFWRAECLRKAGETREAYDEFRNAVEVLSHSPHPDTVTPGAPAWNETIHRLYRGLSATEMIIATDRVEAAASARRLQRAVENIDRAVRAYRDWGGGRTGAILTLENKSFAYLRMEDDDRWDKIDALTADIAQDYPVAWNLTARLIALNTIAERPGSQDPQTCAALIAALFETRAQLSGLHAVSVKGTQVNISQEELRLLVGDDNQQYVTEAIAWINGEKVTPALALDAPCKKG